MSSQSGNCTEVRVAHDFKLPAEAVFDSWLKPELVCRWMNCRVELAHQIDAKWAQYAQQTASGWTRMLKGIEGAQA